MFAPLSCRHLSVCWSELATATKTIKDVKVGDKVKATNPKTGKTAVREVTATITGTGLKHLVTITVDTDPNKPGIQAAQVTATDGHPFWSPQLQLWVPATTLQAGQLLQTSTATWLQITAITHEFVPQQVYNLTIHDIHTYYVAAIQVTLLAHNCPDNNYSYPKREGFEGPPVKTELPAGYRFDRYGHSGPKLDTGRFASPAGTPFEMRALSRTSAARPLTTYEVVTPFEVSTGVVRPWFGQPGGGMQINFSESIAALLKRGLIRVV